MEPMTVNSIPLYWGNPRISEEFNPKSFINYYDFDDMDQMIQYIIQLDKDDNRYLEMLKTPWFENNIIPENNKIENIKSFLYKIFEI
jgi:hypothetical protein